jgi:transcriptional regulator with XRE-family HTH domain
LIGGLAPSIFLAVKIIVLTADTLLLSEYFLIVKGKMRNFSMNFENGIDRLRKFYKSSNAEIEKSLGLSNGYISKIEKNPGKLLLALNDMGISLDWFLTGKGSMYRDKRIHDKNPFEIPFLTQEEALKFEPKQAIPEPKANSGDQPDYDFVLAPRRLLEYSTDLRAFEVFDSRMFPVFKSGDIAIIQATGWKGNGIYLYRMGGALHVSYAKRVKGETTLITEDETEITYDAQTFQAIGRVRAIVKDLFAFDWVGGTQPPRES